MSIAIQLCLTPPVQGWVSLDEERFSGCEQILMDYPKGGQGTLAALLERMLPPQNTPAYPEEGQPLTEYVEGLAQGLVCYIHTLDPEKILLSGGPCSLGAPFFTALQKRVGELCFFSEFAKILPAKEGVAHA